MVSVLFICIKQMLGVWLLKKNRPWNLETFDGGIRKDWRHLGRELAAKTHLKLRLVIMFLASLPCS